MPGSRRPLSRLQATPPPLAVRVRPADGSCSPSASAEDKDSSNPLAALVMPPKHAHVPEIPVDGNLTFEVMVFVFSVIALGLQYINLYKTVWWLPHSHAKYALNFYLIDPHLVMFLVALISRRMLWCFYKETFRKLNRNVLFYIVQSIKMTVVGTAAVTFSYAAYHVVMKYTLLYSLFLCYPLGTYCILFGFKAHPFFGKNMLNVGFGSDKGTPKHKGKDSTVKDTYYHNCTSSPESVREEVNTLKTDFNCRIKQVLFNSMLVAYYMAFIPVCFAQNTLYYDTWWVGQHVVLVWISAFVMYMIHFLPARYVDVCHRCSLHLGRWIKVESRHAHVPYNLWSELATWQHGVLVKHVKGLFKADGINNAAEPGNSMHSKFYFMFHQPVRVTNWLLLLTLLLVGYQFIQLIQASEWSHVLSLALLLIKNYYMLFKLMRDRMVLCRAYKDESQSWH